MSDPRYIIEHPAIIVLAAGSSRRLGTPKQALLYKGKSLLQHAVDAALQTATCPVFVVTGAYPDVVKKELVGMDVALIQNDEWQEGMAASLRTGLAAVQKIKKETDGIIFMVSDQPHVNSSLLSSLLSLQNQTGKPIAACSYDNHPGTPALFHQFFFSDLMALKGDTGARKLIRRHEDQVATISFPNGIIDIDTNADYEKLLNFHDTRTTHL